MKIKKQNILINNAGAGFLISSTGVIYSTGAWGCSHQIYYSFSASASLLRIHSLLITISSSSRRSLKSLQCEEANSYILSMSTAPVISPLLMITRIFVPSGFVSYVINHCGNGWNYGRLTAEGLRGVCTYVSPGEAKPGDLIFFQGTYNTSGASHVGIYVGNNMMIHCGDPIHYSNISTSYWQQHFMCFGRLP